MERITNLVNALEEFKDNINQYMEEITISIEDDIIEANVYQHDELGQDRNGNPITPPYAASTIRYKKKKGQPTNRVTLHDTGQYHDTFKIRYYEDGFEIYANDSKEPYLRKKYGSEIYGLQEEFLKEFAEQVYLPKLIEKLKNKL